jgi:hypothetical protein
VEGTQVDEAEIAPRQAKGMADLEGRRKKRRAKWY